jgi:hypothetical protein
MLLGVHSRKTGWKEICNRRYSASIAFSVNVAESTLEKQAKLWLRSFMNIGTISKRIFQKTQN